MDGRFVIHESFKDLKARRAEQEAYRKALEEQIMQRKQMQEEEREREKYESQKLYRNSYCNDNESVKQGSTLGKGNIIAPPASYRGSPSPRNQSHLPHNHLPPSPKFQGEGSHFQNMNEVDNFNEPHPAALAENTVDISLASATGNASMAHAGQPGTLPVPITDIPPDCMKYIQQVLPGFTLPTPRSLPDQGSKPVALKAPASLSPKNVHETAPAPSIQYNDQAFSSGTSSESSSYEDVLASKSVTQPKVHVSQTSDQLAGVKVSRTQYRAELQQQIEEKRKREDEIRKREQEAEARIQEKIRIDQEKMQRDYEEELRKQQEKELEAEKKRLASLGKHSEIVKAEEKMKARQRRLAEQPPSQREATSARLPNSEDPPRQADSSESMESMESICEFFDTTTSSTQESVTRRSGKFMNPDDRIIPVVANRLKEEALQKELELENSKLENSCVDDKANKETPWDAMSDKKNIVTPNVRIMEGPSGDGNGRGFRGSTLTARVCSAFELPPEFQQNQNQDELTKPGLARELAIRSAPGSTNPGYNPKGQEFLTSLKSYLEDEKSKLMDRIHARGSKSNEGF